MKLNIVLPYTLCTKKLNHMIVPSVVIETVFIGDVLKVVYHVDLLQMWRHQFSQNESN